MSKNFTTATATSQRVISLDNIGDVTLRHYEGVTGQKAAFDLDGVTAYTLQIPLAKPVPSVELACKDSNILHVQNIADNHSSSREAIFVKKGPFDPVEDGHMRIINAIRNDEKGKDIVALELELPDRFVYQFHAIDDVPLGSGYTVRGVLDRISAFVSDIPPPEKIGPSGGRLV